MVGRERAVAKTTAAQIEIELHKCRVVALSLLAAGACLLAGSEASRLTFVLDGMEMCPGARWEEMLPRMRALPDGVLGPEQLLTHDFLLDAEGRLEIYWIPFERMNHSARVAIIGLTPGWHQMQEAFTAARDAFRAGLEDDMAILERINRQAGFAGSMRTNMVKMLDAIGLPDVLEVPASADLFEERDDLIHGTSALRYPVFAAGKNYGGGNPRVDQIPLLARQVRERLASELAAIPGALLLPLGIAVEGCLRILIADGQLDETRCLFGFPHPSGANGHRAAHFAQNRDSLQKQLSTWAAATNEA